jgi:hypothetical protein
VKLTERSRLVTVAMAVGDALRRHGIKGVLTGGACASLFTGGAYQSVDVDFVLAGGVTQDRLDTAMMTLEFARRRDRYVHPRVRFFVEFPRGPLAIGGDYRIRPVRQALGSSSALTLSPTDSCRDRLSAFYHWNDRRSLAVAVAIAVRHRVRLKLIRTWSEDEGAPRGFEEFQEALKAARARPHSAMAVGRRK